MDHIFFKKKSWLVLIPLLIIVFILGNNPISSTDTFYHVKAGEVFVQHGLLSKDIFSYVASGRTWYHYEWLFEIIIYLVQKTFGYTSLAYFFAGISTLQVAVLFFIMKKYFRLSTLFACILSISYFLWNQGFLNGRPQIFGLLFFITTLGFILWFIKTDKNFLWITAITTYIWANMHGTVVFGIYLFFAYASVCFFIFWRSKEKKWLHKARILGIFGLLSALLSVLPPIGFMQYQLLFLFTRYQNIVRSFITEWQPLYEYFFSYASISYLLLALLAIVPLGLLTVKAPGKTNSLLMIPLVIFLLLPYAAVRNISFAFIATIFIWAELLASWHPDIKTLKQKIFANILILALFTLNITSYITEGQQTIAWYATSATDFLLKHHISGNMFNDFDSGFYLLYKLYPTYKIFVDGRMDVYLCCEVNPYQSYINTMLFAKDDDAYRFFSSDFIQKYHQSFVVILTRVNEHQVRLLHLLSNHSEWEPVFWDDAGIIFVRNDGKNTQLLKDFGATVATPYSATPIRNNNLNQALKEYQRMIGIADSARSRNALGYIYLKQKNSMLAQQEFEKAIALNPTFDSPYLNLGEISLAQGNIQQAIDLYQQAKKINPTRAFIYLRLAQLYQRYLHDPQSAQGILQEGLQNAATQVDKKALQSALQAIQLP